MKISWVNLLREARYQAQKRHLPMEMAQFLVKVWVLTELQAELFSQLMFHEKSPSMFHEAIALGILSDDKPFPAVLVISDIPPREIRIGEDGTVEYYEFGQVSPF